MVDRSRADEYYLEGGGALAEFCVVDGSGEVVGFGALTPEEYASWVDWINPFTNESMGTRVRPGTAGRVLRGSRMGWLYAASLMAALSLACSIPQLSLIHI